MRVFVTGAAGYIGSVVVERLLQENYEVFAFDNLSTGNRKAVDSGARFIEGDLCDKEFLGKSLGDCYVDAVVHLAALSSVEESMREPDRYFQANVEGGKNLLDTMNETNVKRIVVSSTASVYGEPKYLPIDEDHPREPLNPYGASKLQFEKLLQDWAAEKHCSAIALRYFNACGATWRYGESRVKESHIIPILFDVASGKRKSFQLFGSDYDTPDGTCIRDYVHVSDIASAHLLALESMESGAFRAYNIGSSTGYSNLQVIDAVKNVTGRDIQVQNSQRREGDPARLVASNALISKELGWRADFKDVESMVQTAWEWHLAHPHGYEM